MEKVKQLNILINVAYDICASDECLEIELKHMRWNLKKMSR